MNAGRAGRGNRFTVPQMAWVYRVALAAFVFVLVLVGCASPEPAPPPATVAAPTPPRSEYDNDVLVTAEEFGSAWPLAIDRGILRCRTKPGRRKEVVLSTMGADGADYGLNGAARGNALNRDGNELLLQGRTGGDMRPLIDRGLALCQ